MADLDSRTYWDERHSRTSGLSGVGYLGLRGYNDWMYRVRRHVFRRVLRPYQDRLRGARLLDVGSGTGFYMREWMRHPIREIVGADFSAVAVDRLVESFPGVRIEVLDIATSDTAPVEALGRFDFISAMDVLFHIVDDARYESAFWNLATLLEPDGFLLFTENFLHAPRSGSAWQTSRTLVEVVAALSSAGMRIATRMPLFVLMNNPIDSSSSLLRRGWSLIQKLSTRSWLAGSVLGAAMYPAELLLVRALKESPTTEIAVAVHG